LTSDSSPRFFASKDPTKDKELESHVAAHDATVVSDLAKKAPSTELEEVYKHYQLFKLQQICVMLKTSKKVMATALVFFKRFYLSNSVLEHDTSSMLLTAIYLSAKIEEEYMDVDYIVRTLELQAENKYVLENEMKLLRGINFQLAIFHPFRTIKGFVEGWRLYERRKDDPMEVDGGKSSSGALTLNGKLMNKIINLADNISVKALVYDSSSIYPPAQIALAALDKSIRKTQDDDQASASLWAQLEEQHGEEKMAQLRVRIVAIQQLMEAEEGNEVKLAEKAKNAGEELPADFPQVKALSYHLKNEKWKKLIKKFQKKLTGGGEKKAPAVDGGTVAAVKTEGSVKVEPVVKPEVKVEGGGGAEPAPKRVKTEGVKMEI
jgi:hypothetical protein